MLPLHRPHCAAAVRALGARVYAQGVLRAPVYPAATAVPPLVRGARNRAARIDPAKPETLNPTERAHRKGRTWDPERKAKEIREEFDPMNSRAYRKFKEAEAKEKERERTRRAQAEFEAEQRGDPTEQGYARARTAGQRKIRVQTPTGRMRTIPSAASFAKIGVNANLAAVLTQRFPSIRAPTPAQAVLIPSMLARPRSDLILRAQTGNGKSFGTLLALLSQPRLKLKTTLGGKPLEQRLDKSWDRSQARRDIEGVRAAKHAAHEARHMGALGKPDGRVSAGEQNDPSVLTKPAVSALVVVPSNDLAFQYRDWARHVLPNPEGSFTALDPILQVLVRKDPARSDAGQLAALKNTPPHVLVATPARLREILDDHTIPGGGGRSLLGLRTMRTLVLDEVDALFQLPGRYPTEKKVWQMERHPPVGLGVMNDIMRMRPTMSGGPGWSGAGMEKEVRRDNSSRAVPLGVRGRVHQGTRLALAKNLYATPLPRSVVDQKGVFIPPLQVVAISATANSVLRHFLGGRTGWLRVGQLERGRFTGQWIDLTGQSRLRLDAGNRTDVSRGLSKLEPAVRLALEVGSIPSEIDHYCLAVDEVQDGNTANEVSTDPRKTPLPGVRNLYLRPSRTLKSQGARVSNVVESIDDWDAPETDEFIEDKAPVPRDKLTNRGEEPYSMRAATTPKAVMAYKPPEPAMDFDLVETAAFVYASVAAGHGVVLIPNGWSQKRVIQHLNSLGVPAEQYMPYIPPGATGEQPLGSGPSSSSSASASPLRAGPWSRDSGKSRLYVLTADQARGIHIPDLSQVFILTTEAVKSAPNYTHLAGRAARLRTAHSSEVHPAAREAEKQEQAKAAADGDEVKNPGPSPVAFGRPAGQVFTIVRGVPVTAQGWTDTERLYKPKPNEPTVVSSEELRFGSILQSLNVAPKEFPLTSKLDGPPEQAAGSQASSSATAAPVAAEPIAGASQGDNSGTNTVYDMDEDAEGDDWDWVEGTTSWRSGSGGGGRRVREHLSEEEADRAAVEAHLAARRRAQAELEAELEGESRKRARSAAATKLAEEEKRFTAAGLEPGAEVADEAEWSGDDMPPIELDPDFDLDPAHPSDQSQDGRLASFDFTAAAKRSAEQQQQVRQQQQSELEPELESSASAQAELPRRRRRRSVSSIASLEAARTQDP